MKKCPREAVPDRVRPMSEQYFSLQCMIDGETQSLLKQAQDLLSQNQSKAVGVGDLFKPILKEFLNRHHPVHKARRVAGKKAPAPVEPLRPVLAFKNGTCTPSHKPSDDVTNHEARAQRPYEISIMRPPL